MQKHVEIRVELSYFHLEQWYFASASTSTLPFPTKDHGKSAEVAVGSLMLSPLSGLTFQPQPEQSSASPFSHSQRSPSHLAAAPLEGSSLHPSSWLLYPLGGYWSQKYPVSTARRRNITQWGSHSPKWTDLHYFLHNPHLELVLNFSDQAEIWRQLSQITSSLGCFLPPCFYSSNFLFSFKKKKSPPSKMICFRLNITLIQI